MLRRKRCRDLGARQINNRLNYMRNRNKLSEVKNKIYEQNFNESYLNQSYSSLESTEDANCSNFSNSSLSLHEHDNLFDDNVRDLNESLISINNEHDQINEILNNENNILTFKEILAAWSLEYNISHQALNALLRNVKQLGCCFSNLPSDARTLLRTPTKQCALESMGSGIYYHKGLKESIIEQLEQVSDLNLVCPQIGLYLNFDGLPISNSSSQQLWPILGYIVNDGFDNVFLIGNYFGRTKPPRNIFLNKCLVEYDSLNNTGFLFREIRFYLTIVGIIVDTVARTYFTYTPAHNSFLGCSKCFVVGQRINNRTVFLDTNAPLKHDQNFAENLPNNQEISTLEGVGIGIVSQIPLDNMHLGYLGVGRKMIEIYTSSLVHGRQKTLRVQAMDEAYLTFKDCIPDEFVRKPRPLSEFSRWKATESRLFCNYLGPVLLNNFLSKEQLQHFNCLHFAFRILNDPAKCQERESNEYARQLLIFFVEKMKDLYGHDKLTFNFHNLIHLPQDVLTFGPLDSYSAFRFENFLQILKKQLRKRNQPLSQLYKRSVEKQSFNYLKTRQSKIENDKIILHKMKKLSDNLPQGCTEEYEAVKFSSFTLKCKFPNNCCYIGKTVIIVEHICIKNNTPIIIGRKFINPQTISNYPVESEKYGIAMVSQLSEQSIWPIQFVDRKGFLIPLLSHEIGTDTYSYYVFPLLHSDFD